MRCPACNGERATVLLVASDHLVGGDERFSVARCDACAHIYTHPHPEHLGRHYPAGSYYAYQSVRSSRLERFRLWLIIHVAYRPLAHRPPGRLLDVGCGAGRLADAFRRRGWEVCGIEPSPAGAAAAAASGLEVHCGTLEDAPWPQGRFDAVIFNHSLEHVRDPDMALSCARDLLRPGGLVGVTVPNFASWQRRLFGAAWFQLDVPRHLQHFERRTLEALLERCEFDPVVLRTTSMMAGLLGSTQYRAFGRLIVSGRAFRVANLVLYPLLALSDLIAEGDCVNAVARRR